MERKQADRERLNDIWVRMLDNRERLAAQAGFKDYREFRWKELLRFDYTPEDCATFQAAIQSAERRAANSRLIIVVPFVSGVGWRTNRRAAQLTSSSSACRSRVTSCALT